MNLLAHNFLHLPRGTSYRNFKIFLQNLDLKESDLIEILKHLDFKFPVHIMSCKYDKMNRQLEITLEKSVSPTFSVDASTFHSFDPMIVLKKSVSELTVHMNIENISSKYIIYRNDTKLELNLISSTVYSHDQRHFKIEYNEDSVSIVLFELGPNLTQNYLKASIQFSKVFMKNYLNFHELLLFFLSKQSNNFKIYDIYSEILKIYNINNSNLNELLNFTISYGTHLKNAPHLQEIIYDNDCITSYVITKLLSDNTRPNIYNLQLVEYESIPCRLEIKEVKTSSITVSICDNYWKFISDDLIIEYIDENKSFNISFKFTLLNVKKYDLFAKLLDNSDSISGSFIDTIFSIIGEKNENQFLSFNLTENEIKNYDFHVTIEECKKIFSSELLKKENLKNLL